MKKQKIVLFLLMICVFLLISSCGKSNKSNNEDTVSNNPQTDDYAILREPSYPRVVEDLSGKVNILYEKDFIERITAVDNPKGFQYLGQIPCIVALYADWCKPCGYQTELMSKIAPEYQGRVIFYKLNVDKAPYVKSAFKVENIPMILFFKPRGEISTTVGYLNREKLHKMIEELLLNS